MQMTPKSATKKPLQQLFSSEINDLKSIELIREPSFSDRMISELESNTPLKRDKSLEKPVVTE
jgi:hypothetical protein